MSVVMANALGTGIFCGLWQGIGSVLGLATWMGCDRNWSFLLADLLSIKNRSIILGS